MRSSACESHSIVHAYSFVCRWALSSAAEIPFKDQELPTKLGVGYAVRLVDMNARPAAGYLRSSIRDRILWLENPNWNEHVILQGQTKKDNVCFAPHDIDGDGQRRFRRRRRLAAVRHEDRRHDPVDHRRQEAGRALDAAPDRRGADDPPDELCRSRRRRQAGADRLAADGQGHHASRASPSTARRCSSIRFRPTR